MISLIKEIILEYQHLELVPGTPRRAGVESLRGKATVCIGVRRCGKSTYMQQLISGLLEGGVSRQNILYLNFFDDRLHGLQSRAPDLIIEAYFSLYPDKKNTERIYCFFDEIQVLPQWEPFVDRLMRTEKCDVYITGSSANLLSREIATQLRGRSLSWEMFPFSFPEFLDHHAIDSAEPITAKKRLTIQKAFENYWETGGFPEVASLDRRLRVRIHQEYFNAMLFRDLVERHDISHPKAVTDLAHWLIDNTASLYSVNNLTGYLKSLGHKVPKSVVSDYLDWFEDAYAFFTVRIFDASLARSNTNPKKIYCIDHALVTSTNSGILVNNGHLLENLVYVTLRRKTQDVFYYKTRAGREVDFITSDPSTGRQLVQVCETLADPRTRKREVSALSEAMRELHISSSCIVTRHEQERIDTDSGVIHVVPVWTFLLDMDKGQP